MDEKHAYELLGLSEGASFSEVRQAYRDLSLVWHPDRFPDHPRLKAKAEDQLRAVKEAHDFIIGLGKTAGPGRPASRPADTPVARPRHEGKAHSSSAAPNPLADPANLLFGAFVVWSLASIGRDGGSAGFARAVVVPLFFSLAYNIFIPAQQRLRRWYVGATCVFALLAAAAPRWQYAHDPVVRDATGPEASDVHLYGGGASITMSPGFSPLHEPAASAAPRGPYDPMPPAAPVPPAPPAVPAARAR